MYAYVYIYVYTYIYTYISAYIYVYIHSYINICYFYIGHVLKVSILEPPTSVVPDAEVHRQTICIFTHSHVHVLSYLYIIFDMHIYINV
jgi:hypothetical protein